MEALNVNHETAVRELTTQVGRLESSKSTLPTAKTDEKIRSLQLDAMLLKTDYMSNRESLQAKGVNVQKIDASFDNLTTRINNIKSKMPGTFVAELPSSVSDKIVSKVSNAVKDSISAKIRGYAFMGAFKNKRDKELPKKLAETRMEVKQLKTESDDLKNQKESFSKEKQKLVRELKHLKTDPARNSQQIKEKTSESNKITIKINVIDQKQTKVAAQIKSKHESCDKLEKSLNTKNYYEGKGDSMRRDLQTLGAERVTITTPDGANLDSMYLDAQKFRSSMKEAGCKLTTLTIKGTDNTPRVMQAISLSQENYDKNGSKVLDALKDLNALGGNSLDETGAGWTVVKQDDEYLLVRSEELPKANIGDNPHFALYEKDDKLEWRLKAGTQVLSSQDQEIDVSNKGSATVILSSGNAGVYEMHKSEAMFYLFKNVNVVMFNFRGYGHSEGEPTENGMKLDMESAYQFAKNRSGHQDSQIIFKALCMSGGPASYVAAQHPETNIILDQSYSDFKTLIAENAQEKAVAYTKTMLGNENSGAVMGGLKQKLTTAVASLTHELASFAAPDFNTAQNLAQNNGNKVIFFTHDDDLMKTSHMEANVKAIAKAGKMEYLTVISAPGEHGDSVIGISASAANYNPKVKTLRDECLELNSKANLIQTNGEKKHNELEAETQVLRDEGKTKEADIKEKEASTFKMQYEQESNNLILQLNTKKEQLGQELVSMGIKLKGKREDNTPFEGADINEIINGTNLDGNTMVGQNQLTHFLNKAQLGKDIVRTGAEMKQSPVLRTISNFTTELEGLSKLTSKFSGRPVEFKLTDNKWEVSLITSSDYINTEVHPQEIQQILAYKNRLGELSKKALEFKQNRQLDEANYNKITEHIANMTNLAECVSRDYGESMNEKLESFAQSLDNEQVESRNISKGVVNFENELKLGLQEMNSNIGQADKANSVLEQINTFEGFVEHLEDRIDDLNAQKEAVQKLIEENPTLSDSEKLFKEAELSGVIDISIAHYRQTQNEIKDLIQRGTQALDVAKQSQVYSESLQTSITDFTDYVKEERSKFQEILKIADPETKKARLTEMRSQYNSKKEELKSISKKLSEEIRDNQSISSETRNEIAKRLELKIDKTLFQSTLASDIIKELRTLN